METIIIVLNPGKLENPDLDLRYEVPERIEEVTEGAVKDNGYTYQDTEPGQPGPLMLLYLETASAAGNWPRIAKLLAEETFLDNDLSQTAEIYIAAEKNAELEACTQVFPA